MLVYQMVIEVLNMGIYSQYSYSICICGMDIPQYYVPIFSRGCPLWMTIPHIHNPGCNFLYRIEGSSTPPQIARGIIHTYTMLDHSTHGNFHAYVQTNPHRETERMNWNRREKHITTWSPWMHDTRMKLRFHIFDRETAENGQSGEEATPSSAPSTAISIVGFNLNWDRPG